jgi:hypothetical protein
MTLALSASLQRALFERLSTAPALADLADRIFDDAPHRSRDIGEMPYLTLGDERVLPWNTSTDHGAVHEAVIRIYAPVRGFLLLKQWAAIIAEVIDNYPPTPDRGALVTQELIQARTFREEQGALRRIDLTFRFVIEDTETS